MSVESRDGNGQRWVSGLQWSNYPMNTRIGNSPSIHSKPENDWIILEAVVALFDSGGMNMDLGYPSDSFTEGGI